MLYAKEGLPLVEDAYELPGLEQNRYRKLVKSTFFKLINAREGHRDSFCVRTVLSLSLRLALRLKMATVAAGGARNPRDAGKL